MTHSFPKLDVEPRTVRPPFTGGYEPVRHADMAAALTKALMDALAEVELGTHDKRIIRWLAGWDMSVVATVASLLHRARAAGETGRSSVPTGMDRDLRVVMDALSTVPFPGSLYSVRGCRGEVELYLDEEHAAEALLAWFYRLTKADIRHHHSSGKAFVTVSGHYEGVQIAAWTSFDAPDELAVVCDSDSDRGPLSVHRLRKWQMVQRSGGDRA